MLNLIRAHALLHQASRQRDASGRIVATLDDYRVVRDLIADLVSDAAGATVARLSERPSRPCPGWAGEAARSPSPRWPRTSISTSRPSGGGFRSACGAATCATWRIGLEGRLGWCWATRCPTMRRSCRRLRVCRFARPTMGMHEVPQKRNPTSRRLPSKRPAIPSGQLGDRPPPEPAGDGIDVDGMILLLQARLAGLTVSVKGEPWSSRGPAP